MKKRKKIIKTIILSSLMLCLCFSGFLNVKAQEDPIIHYIFDKQEVKKEEEFSLTVILDKYQNLSTVQFVCIIDKNIFEPVIKNNQYFVEPTLSIFDKSEIYENTFVETEGILRFVAITKGGKTYDSSGLNQVFTISFKANQDISKVEEYFYEQDMQGSKTLLIDKWAKEVKAEVSYNEVLKASWDEEKYEVEVFDKVPNILKDIKVLNRQESEYKIEIITDDETLNIIGSKVIKVRIYDFITSQIIYLAKPLLVVDKTSPNLEYFKSEILLEDVKIDISTFEYFVVKDNYDENPVLVYKYYNDKDEELLSLEEFKKYLKNNPNGKITCYAVDSSNNKSSVEEVKIKIKDTIAPYINEITMLEIIDTEIDRFNLESLMVISDDYDNNPKFLFKIITNNEKVYTNYLEALRDEYDITIEYWTIDKSNNESKHINLSVKLIDTISPTINNIKDIIIPDEDLVSYLSNHHLLEKDFEINDNFKKEVMLDIVYYNNDKIITEEEFYNNLKMGISGKVTYQAIDSYNNKSKIYSQNVSVLDDTAPSITVNNLENDKQYLGPIKIDYQVKDNIDEQVTVEITINGNAYNGEDLIDLMEYTLIIVASDGSGNKTTKEVKFEIVEENLFGCIDGIDCKENNYALGIIIGIIIVVIASGVVLFKVIYDKKHKNQVVEE